MTTNDAVSLRIEIPQLLLKKYVKTYLPTPQTCFSMFPHAICRFQSAVLRGGAT